MSSSGLETPREGDTIGHDDDGLMWGSRHRF
jgi:hypothetical protein